MTPSKVEYEVLNLIDLARILGKPVILYDFESTTFRGRENFAIIEAGFLAAVPAGVALTYETLVNPEAQMDAEAMRLTGLTNAMLNDYPTVDVQVLPHFEEYGPKAWFGGFNNKTFDEPAIKDMAAKYKRPEPKLDFRFDVRQLYREIMNNGSKTGTLTEVAAAFGVVPRGQAHRAMADTVMTAELLNALCSKFGTQRIAAIMQTQNEPKAASQKKVSAQAVAKAVRGRNTVTLDELSKEFKVERTAIAYEVGKAIDERLVNPDVFAHAKAQDWLDLHLQLLEPGVFASGRLKAVADALPPGPPELDYVQLRVGMLRQGLRWGALKD